MDLLHVFYLLGAGLTGSRYYCSVVWPGRFGGSLKEEITAILIFGLLWLGGILVAAVLGNLLFDVQLIADFAAWQPFESRWLGCINGIQLGTGLLAITLFLFFVDMRDEYFTLFNPLMDFAMITVFYAVFCPAAFLILWLLDLALVRFF
jgi:hypothetical protein